MEGGGALWSTKSSHSVTVILRSPPLGRVSSATIGLILTRTIMILIFFVIAFLITLTSTNMIKVVVVITISHHCSQSDGDVTDKISHWFSNRS